MLKFRKNLTSPVVRFEKVKDFSRDCDTLEIIGYYMISYEIFSCINIPLHVDQIEEVTSVYLLSKSSSDWARYNLDYDKTRNKVQLDYNIVKQFDLVRVIPENGLYPVDSFLRVMLKTKCYNSIYSSIDEVNEEMFGGMIE